MSEPLPVVPPRLRPSPGRLRFSLEPVLDAVLHLEARIPEDAFTAEILGTERRGSGVLVHESGLVLTIGYLVCEAEEIWLRGRDGEIVPAHLRAYDFDTGFGLVQALSPLPAAPVELGRSAEIRVGSELIVAAAGGLVSAVQARLVARREFAGYWEYLLDEALFTAPAHPWWGGAACFDSEGMLVGIGSLLVQGGSERQPERTNMIVPIELLDPILDDLIQRGRARRRPRPWLGVYLQESEEGLVVFGLAEGGPAARAGIEPGDRIFEIADVPVCELADFYRLLWSLGPAGIMVPLHILRDGRRRWVRIRSADRNRFLKRPSLH